MRFSNHQRHPGAGPASVLWLAPALVLVLVLGAAGASASPLSGALACSRGWDQLLSPGERQQALQQQGCGAATVSATTAAPALAEQMDVYQRSVTSGPLGPLAGPNSLKARSRATGALVPRAARRAQAPMGVGSMDPRPVALAPLIERTARAHDIDPLLLHAIARVESRHRVDAISHAGAHGLMQVIVPTARRFGVDAARELHDPQTNLDVSARYLKTLQQRFGNDLPLVLAAYNAGEGAVERYGRRIPPYRETQGYVRSVMAEYTLLRRITARPSSPAWSRVAAESAL